MPARPSELAFDRPAASAQKMPPKGHQQRRRRGGRGGGNNQRNAQRKQAWPHRNGGNGQQQQQQQQQQRQQQQGGHKKQQGWRQNSRSQLRRGTHNSITGHESSAPKKLAASAAAYTPPGRNSRPRAGSGDTARSHISEMSAASVLTEVAQDTTIRPAGNAKSVPAWGADVANGGRPTAENPFSEDAGGPNGPHNKSRANWRQSKKERMMQKLTTERDRQVFRLIKNGDHDDRLKDLINYKGIEPSESFLRKTAQCAAKFVRHKCIFLLVDHCGVDVDTNLQKGCTALHYAAFAGSDSLCRGLMYRGANRETLNSYGETPAGTARSQGHEACAKMIEGYDIAKEHLGMINKERRASQLDAAASPRGSSRSPPGSPKSPAVPHSGAEASGRELAWRRRDAPPSQPVSASTPVGAAIAAAAQEAYAEEDSAAAALDAILNPPAKQKRRVRRLVRSLQRLKLSYLEMPHLIRNVLLQLAQMEVFERTRVAKSLLRKVIVSEDEDPQTFLVALCAKMFAAQLEICGGQPDGEGPPVNEAVAPDSASAATATSGSSATTMSSFGSRSTASSKSSDSSPRDSDDGSSVFSDVSMNSQLHKALLHSTTFLDVCLQLCTQETDRVKKMLTGSLCLDIGNEDDMIIENVEQLSRETLEARVTIMEKLIVELQNHRGGIISA